MFCSHDEELRGEDDKLFKSDSSKMSKERLETGEKSQIRCQKKKAVIVI